MQDGDEDTRQSFQVWFGWYVCFMMAITLAIIAIANSNRLRSVASSPEEAHCLRDWIGAFDRWITLIIAVPTVFSLARQTYATEMLHIRSMKITHARTLSLAKNIMPKILNHIADCEFRLKWWHILMDTTTLDLTPKALQEIELSLMLLKGRDMTRFEDEITTPHTSCATIAASLEDGVPAITKVMNNKDICEAMKANNTVVARYLRDVEKGAAAYIAEFKKLTQPLF